MLIKHNEKKMSEPIVISYVFTVSGGGDGGDGDTSGCRSQHHKS